MSTMTTMTTEIGSEAEAVIERIRHVASLRTLDRERAEAALAGYLKALGLEARPVRWIKAEGDRLASARQGFKTAWETLLPKGRPEVLGLYLTAVDDALYGPGLRRRGLIGAAEKQEKAAGFSVRHQAHQASKAVRKRLDVEQVSRHADLMSVLEQALGDKGIRFRTTMIQQIGSTPEARLAAKNAELNREIAVGDATRQAAQAADWLARAYRLHAAGKPADALDRAAHALLPLVDAVEAGLWLFWVAEDVVIAVPRPDVE